MDASATELAQVQHERDTLYVAVEEQIRHCPVCHGVGHTYSRTGPGDGDVEKDECQGCSGLEMALARVNGEIVTVEL